MDTATVPESARDRLLVAAADLLDQAHGSEVSTRAICERAGVQAPTLYHHFGSKQKLLDTVISHGFREFLADRAEVASGEDPIDDIRRGWDLHVQFGLENPGFYARIYGRPVPGEPCGVVAEVEAMILQALQPAALRGLLRISPPQAARQILAAGTGVVLTLISQPTEERDPSLSDNVRDAVLDHVRARPVGRPRHRAADDPVIAPAAIALRAALVKEGSPLGDAETALLEEWLIRLGGA